MSLVFRHSLVLIWYCIHNSPIVRTFTHLVDEGAQTARLALIKEAPVSHITILSLPNATTKMASKLHTVVTHRTIPHSSNIMDTDNNSNSNKTSCSRANSAAGPRSAGSPRPAVAAPVSPRIDETKIPQEVQEHGSDTRRYLQRHITPTLLEGMKQLASLEPEKPIQALGKFFLGIPVAATTTRVPYTRTGPAATMAMEGVKLLAATQNKPEDHIKWMGEWLLARSAELE